MYCTVTGWRCTISSYWARHELSHPYHHLMSLPAGLSSTYWRTWQHTGSVQEGLQEGEEWIGSWTNVGLYKESVSQTRVFPFALHAEGQKRQGVRVSDADGASDDA